MTNEISPRTVRFSHNEDEVRPERSRRSHPVSADSENSNLTDHTSRPTHPAERHSDASTHSRYSESSSHPPPVPSLITTSTNGLPRVTNGSLRTAANRPGITRTPSSTYNPQRGPPPQSASHDTRAAKRTESAGPRRQRIAKNVDPTYVAVLQRRDGSYFPNEYPESDSEGETPSSEGPFDERYHDTDEHIIFQETFGDHEPTAQDLANPDNRERLEWYGMLQTVLTGDVVKQEKKRLIGTSDLEDIKTPQRSEELWTGIRSRTCGRTLAVQRKMVEDARASLDSVADWVTTFKVIGESEARKSHIEQMMDALGKIETLGSAYPSWKALEAKHKSVTSPSFREAYEAIVAWYNTYNIINTQLSILKRWVGNDSLDFQKTKPLSPSANGIGDESSFLDRLLKEDGMKSFHEEEEEKEEKVQDKKKIQRKPMLPCISEVVTKVKETTLQYHESFHKRHFPSYDEELLLLMTFPTRLIEDVIKVRLAYARKVKESAQQNPMMQDQMIGQFQLLLKLAIKIKQEYMAFAETQDGWDFAAPLDDSFDQVVLEALKYYFKMLNWKLSGNRNTFKEAELLFQEWEFANDIGSHLLRGGIQVSEHFSSLTFKALNRLSQTFEKEIQRKPRESALDMSKRYKACLDSVRVRQRMLQRFSRMLSDNYENACDFNIASTSIDPEALFDHLIDSNHFQLYTANIERDGIFLLASPSLWDRPDDIQRMMTLCSEDDMTSDPTDPYILIMRPEVPFTWYGQKMNITLQEDTIDLRLGHARLIASGSRHRLINARKAFLERLGQPLDLVVEQRSNFHKVNQKMTEIRRVAFKLSNTFMDSVEKLRNQTVGLDCQELIQTCFVFATEFGQRSLLIMDSNRRQMNNIKLTKLALDWVTFVCDDCKVSERKTFRWAVLALEFALGMTRGRQILALTDDEYAKLRSKVSGCMSILITHFDIMGARSMFAAQAERDKQRIDALMSYFKRMDENRVLSDDESSKLISRGRLEKLEEVEDDMVNRQPTRNPLGRVLEVSNDVDRSLIFLSSTASANMALRWQLGHFVGGGTFGNVYAAMNLDTGQLMAVKEIRLQDPKQIPAIAGQIKDEMAVLELLNHPNVVSYYGIEVHRDRVYIFMEYCSGGSLASLLEHGRIEDEGVIQVYALQLLEGLAYLHASSITHRDIKPENILLDHNGVIKYVDFGAAKVIARQGKTLVTSLTSTKANKSMTGTPMYMSPEVITGDKSGRASAADVWSLGCVILEMTTGRRPWANLDNEWAIMYNIANGNPPQLPSPDQLSLQGIDFLERCFDRDPRERATAEKLLQHPWIMSIRNQVIEPPTPSESSASTMSTPLVTPTTSTGLSPTISMAAAAKMETGSGNLNGINVLNQELGR